MERCNWLTDFDVVVFYERQGSSGTVDDGEKCCTASSSGAAAAAAGASVPVTSSSTTSFSSCLTDAGVKESAACEADDEAWAERTAVITKYDHETYRQLARDVVADIADHVVQLSFQQDPRKPVPNTHNELTNQLTN